MYTVNSQIETMSKEETKIISERAIWDKKVAMMRPGSVDKDLLEERARAVLGYQKPHEYTVLSN